MKNHAFRPLWVAIILVALVLLVRPFLVPDDFGVHGDSFTYNYHRASNEQEWKDFPVKYLGRDYCIECHEENFRQNQVSVHQNIQCENCHGPSAGHPDDIENLPVDDSRELCRRCHELLEYPSSQRADIPGIDGERHKRRRPCTRCHDPHNPTEEDV